MSDPTGPTGWHPDPTGRYEHRWFNGHQWTADVSVNGRRFVDPAGPTFSPGQVAVSPLGGGPSPAPAAPRGGVACFVVGLVSLAFSPVPFLFVLAAVGALVALGLGVAARRRGVHGDADGSGLVLAGMILAVLALPLCALGWYFTGRAIDALDELQQPGDHRIAIDACVQDGRLVTLEGAITNLEDTYEDFIIVVEIHDGVGGQVVEELVTEVKRVAPGATEDFTGTAFVDATTDAQCTLRDVLAPSLLSP